MDLLAVLFEVQDQQIVCLFVCLSVCLSVCLCVCLSVCLSVCLEAILTSHTYAMNLNEFCLVSHLRLGMQMQISNWIAQCECGKDVDIRIKKAITCLPANVERFGSTPLFCHVGVN